MLISLHPERKVEGRQAGFMKTVFRILFPLIALAAPVRSSAQLPPDLVRLDTMSLMDTARGRLIPVAIYSTAHVRADRQFPVLLSHGYNDNLPGSYLHYTYLAEFLARKGFFVVSIQHELPGDEPLAMKGDLRKLRRPNWERGVQNLLLTLDKMKRAHPEVDFDHTTLIGHSNGGDISALFAEQHPELVENLITLDNRRMPLPRTGRPRVLSLRSSDAPADQGVLPTPEEQALNGIRIIPLPDVKHNEMSDRASETQRSGITRRVSDFISSR